MLLKLASIHFFCILASNALPNRVLQGEDFIENVAKEGRTIEEDQNAFDNIAKINTENDLTGLYEGDIQLVKDATRVSDIPGGKEAFDQIINDKRNVIRAKEYIWPGKVVPYKIDKVLDSVTNLIKLALGEISKSTCITFVPYTNQRNYLEFFKDYGCYSYVGRMYVIPGPNKISLGDGCNTKGIIIHEVLHSLGFWHEQSRNDRDTNIEIIWENIKPGKDSQFSKADGQESFSNYDYASIMHYGAYAFSANGKKTIIPIKDPNASIGQRDGLSPNDIIELNAMYDCKSKSTDFYSTWGNWSPCDASCIKKRQRFCSHIDPTKCPKVNQHGVEDQTFKCTNAECYAPVNGHWGRWADWGSCSKTCGAGMMTRSRQCNDPVPKNGGKACVGVATSTKSCKVVTCNLGPNDCEFLNGQWCGWTNRVDDQLDWTMKSGRTPSAGTGPSGDHTSGIGYYVYLEASSPALPRQKAVLESKVMAAKTRCLTFWYHMFGNDMGKLKVMKKDPSTGAITDLKTISGNKGNQWNEASLQISSTSSYQVLFEAQVGKPYESDIAIDDIYLKDCSPPVDGHWGCWADWGSCSKTCGAGMMTRSRQCNDPVPKNGGKACIGVATSQKSCKVMTCNVGPTNCEFTNGQWCGWTNRVDDQLDWTMKSGRTPSVGTGPSGDHTSGTGYYVYLEASSPALPRQKAVLESKVMAAKTRCLTFWYHMFGNDMGNLHIMKKDFPTGRVSYRMTIYGSMGNQWREEYIQLHAYKSSSSYQLLFEGEVGKSCESDIAIDDIHLKDGLCLNPLGMEDKKIADYQISSSSDYDVNHRAFAARLNHNSQWCANNQKRDRHQFLRVDFDKRYHITAVAVQGQPTWDNWVLTYKLNFTEDGYKIQTYKENGVERVFNGPTNRNTPVKQTFTVRIKTFAVIINPQTYHGNDICMRIEIYGRVDPYQPTKPQGCANDVRPLGMASRLIPDSKITASSIYDQNHNGYEARLNNYKVWCSSSKQKDQFQYIQVDLGKTMLVHGIATQGHPGWDNYVLSYQIEYSTDGLMFYTALEDPKIFKNLQLSGNSDRNTIVKHKLKNPISTRYIRINPKQFIGNDICLRAEIYGCDKV